MPSTEQMEVDVFYCLASILTSVDHRAIAFRKPLAARDLGCGPMQVPDQIAVLFPDLRDGGDVLSGNYEDVNRSLRVDIRKGVAMVVLVNGLRGDAPVDNLAEETAHINSKSKRPQLCRELQCQCDGWRR